MCLAHRYRHPLNLPPVEGGNYGEGDVRREVGAEVAVWEWKQQGGEWHVGNGPPSPLPL